MKKKTTKKTAKKVEAKPQAKTRLPVKTPSKAKIKENPLHNKKINLAADDEDALIDIDDTIEAGGDGEILDLLNGLETKEDDEP